jgi:hypothetical protein
MFSDCASIWPAIEPMSEDSRVMLVLISRALFLDFSARLRTSSATTANPLPLSPARAASMVALRASKLV